jgi:ferredoxin
MAAPAVLDQRDEDGIVMLINPEPDGALAADSRRAASVGPALAITVEE